MSSGASVAILSATATVSFHRHRICILDRRRNAELLISNPAFLSVSASLRRSFSSSSISDLSCFSSFTKKTALPCAAYFNGEHGGAFFQDAGATVLVAAGAYSLVLAFDNLTKRNLIQQSLSRKLVHILSGLLFMFSWPIFSTSMKARYFAALVPLLNCLRLVIYGLSLATDEGLVKSVTREGNPKELLRGPLYYVLILILCVIIFWRESPIGVISLSMMCGGDGFADIMGRRFGALKIPYNQQKSLVGSISMFISGFSIAIGMLYYFSALGYFRLDWTLTLERVALVSLLATVVESLPITEVVDDNISVPLSSILVAFLFFPSPTYSL